VTTNQNKDQEIIANLDLLMDMDLLEEDTELIQEMEDLEETEADEIEVEP
jgi:hypothetical protein